MVIIETQHLALLRMERDSINCHLTAPVLVTMYELHLFEKINNSISLKRTMSSERVH